VENPGKQEQWEKAKGIFGGAIEREPDARNAFLDQACGADATLRAEVESLLAEFGKSVGFSQQPFPLAASEIAAPSDTIGPYRLIKKLGEGGMGQVWLAEQTAPVARQVALKLIRAGLYDTSVLQRFQSERQSLAIMDHPAIAKVFDAGTTPVGQPYFVMEYVPGLQITDYCDEKKLTIRERLELFIKVCEGVQHAHQKAIIHRDLKPANILVVEVDGKPMPRIIDFGLAKAVTPLAAGATLVTQPGNFLGTPGYMSPEQANPGEMDIDTRTDVYSLGVVLYVLLTGFEPFDTRAWRKMPFDEVLRKLREEDPPRPSMRVSTEGEASSPAAEARSIEPKQLATQLRGDLDSITMKAVEKDRARRYGTPSDLAADLRRYLSNQPVLARPTSAAYRTRKYVRRHRLAVAAAGVFVALLVSFAVVQAVQLRRVAQERDRATRERDRADRIAEFMTGIFKVSNPSEARGNSVTAREILDKASKEIDPGLANDPGLQAEMMHVMGNVYRQLGLYSVAQSLMERSVDIGRRADGPRSPEVLSSMNDLALILVQQARPADAEKLQREALELEQSSLSPENPITLSTMSDLASTLLDEGRYAEAVDLATRVLQTQSRVLGAYDPRTLGTLNNLAIGLGRGGHFAEAERLQRQAIEVGSRALGPDNPEVLNAMANLGTTLIFVGRYGEAEAVLQQAFQGQKRILGPQHPGTAHTAYNLACVAARQGHRDNALAVLREAVEYIYPKTLPKIETDPDLESLHGDPRWAEIVAMARERMAAAKKTK
jgi:non-specific serine/threonine protein kinase/serine/threonine-protein kinase